MKRIISVLLIAALAVSMFCVSFASNAAESVTVTFHSNNIMVGDNYKTESVLAGGNVDAFYDLPDVGERYIFKGWYYGKEDDARAVDFDNDTFSADTDIYAHWAGADVTAPDNSDPNKGDVGFYDYFDLNGVQVKAGEFNDTENGGLRFIASLSNKLLAELDALSDSTVGSYNSRVEYGFVAARKTAVDAWKTLGESKGYDLTNYEIGYNGTNVNGVDTTAHDENYQGIVADIDCTASDYSQSTIQDYKKYEGYRLYTVAIVYPKANKSGEDYTDAQLDEFKNADVAVRAYLRYYDGNGLLRTTYDDYNGTDSYGGLCTSYKLTQDKDVDIGYYSTFNKMVTDAKSNTISNADSDQTSAVCSLYLNGGTAYMKLLKNASLAGDTLVNFNADLNLNGNTLNAGSNYLCSNNRFNMYNGTYHIGASSYSFSRHSGELSKITNVNFTGENISVDSTFGGLFVTGKCIYLTSCTFNATVDVSPEFYSVLLYGESNNNNIAVMKDCVTNVNSSADKTAGVYSVGTSVEMTNCETTVEQTDQNNSPTVYCVGAWDCDRLIVDNSEMSFSGDVHKLRGIYARNNDENDTTKRYFEASNVSVDYDINDLHDITANSTKSDVRGVFLGQGEESVISDVDIDITAKALGHAGVYGLTCGENSKVKSKGLDIKASVDETDTIGGFTTVKAYNLNGVYTFGTSILTVSSADICVPIGYYIDNKTGAHDTNSGIKAIESSIITINENDGPVYIQGGNAALNNFDNSKYYISGGHFCSQSHGGAYFSADADITGGTFEVINDGPYVPYEGGMYVTANAVVNISGAIIIGGNNGIRTKSGKNEDGTNRIDNPIVTISNTEIRHGFKYSAWGVNSGAGTITINDGVTIQADNPLYESGGTIIDNRNN